MPEIYIVGLLGHITQYYKAIILQLKNNNNSNKNYFLFFFLKVQNVLFFFFKFENFDLDIGSEVFVRSLSPRTVLQGLGSSLRMRPVVLATETYQMWHSLGFWSLGGTFFRSTLCKLHSAH